MELKGKIIDFLGDSITEGHGVTDCENNRYDNVIKKKCSLKAVCNYGIGGTRIAHQIEPSYKPRHDLCFCGRAYDLNPDADIISVYGGINDYMHGDAPFGEFTDRTPQTFCGAVHYLFRGLIEKYPTKPIIIITPMHRIHDYKPNSSNQKVLKDYVDVIREAAEMYSLPVLDLFASFGICPDIPEQKEAFCPDGLHPNDAGNRVLAEKLKKFLEAI